MSDLEALVRDLYDEYGPRKPMGVPAGNPRVPHYFLHRNFLGDQDLLIIFNTKRCRYQCHFCDLPRKSSRRYIGTSDILLQFEYVVRELRHSLGVLDRLTLSNEGSVLDATTFAAEALIDIAKCSHELRRVRRLVLETRLEFVHNEVLSAILCSNHRVSIDILTGFETANQRIRDQVLRKRETLGQFEDGLDRVREAGCRLTCYVLFKPDPRMSDVEAQDDAASSIEYLSHQCRERGIPLTIRLNPMYAAEHTPWTRVAHNTPGYLPPRLTDVLDTARKKASEDVRIYIGLSSEGLSQGTDTYMAREDYSHNLLKEVVKWNTTGVSA